MTQDKKIALFRNGKLLRLLGYNIQVHVLLKFR